MTTLKEFQVKINKIQDKVNLKEESHQKNKTLLQIIRDICNDTLKEPNLKEEVKNEAKKILKKVENDLSSLKVGIYQEKRADSSQITNNNISVGGYAPTPINNVLNSVHAGAFDPLSSPILRNLQKRSKTKPKKEEIKQKKPETVKKQKEEPVKPQLKPQVKPKVKTVEKKVIKEEPKKVSTPKKSTKPKKKTSTPKEVSTPKKSTKPKKKTSTPKKVSTPKKSTKPKKKTTPLTPAFLEIEQIQLTIQLPFKNSIEVLGRQDFDKENLAIEIPTEFFSPILMRDPENKEAKEHCAIEQIEPKKYFLKDRFNLKKTYFQSKFVDTEGTQLKEGDKFILPVMVNEQLSSLTVVFHVGKKK